MQLISKFNKRFGFLLCVIDIYSKYVCVIPLKYKKKITITKAFQKIVDESKRKLNQAWVEKGSRFYNRSIKSWLEKKWFRNIMNYSTYNEGKCVIAERFIRTLKKNYKYMASVSKMCILIN